MGVFFVMKTLEDERYGVITAYKLAVLEILINLFVLPYIALSTEKGCEAEDC